MGFRHHVTTAPTATARSVAGLTGSGSAPGRRSARRARRSAVPGPGRRFGGRLREIASTPHRGSVAVRAAGKEQSVPPHAEEMTEQLPGGDRISLPEGSDGGVEQSACLGRLASVVYLVDCFPASRLLAIRRRTVPRLRRHGEESPQVTRPWLARRSDGGSEQQVVALVHHHRLEGRHGPAERGRSRTSQRQASPAH